VTNYWTKIERFWSEFPTDDPSAYLECYRSMPAVARDLITTHWVFSEVCNGGFHQLFTNPTGVLVPEAVDGFRSMGLFEMAAITSEALGFFGGTYPREQSQRIEALERYAERRPDPDDWNPFTQLDERFYEASQAGGGNDAYTCAADNYAGEA
jgi:hypothetical protein